MSTQLIKRLRNAMLHDLQEHFGIDKITAKRICNHLEIRAYEIAIKQTQQELQYLDEIKTDSTSLK